MTIASEITRLQNDKAAMCTAIENKGVTVGNVTFDSYAACIDAIQSGGGDKFVDVLVVAGGGSGGPRGRCSSGGGGGAGGVIYREKFLVGDVEGVAIGCGGASVSTRCGVGCSGQISMFGSLEAIGGGGGGGETGCTPDKMKVPRIGGSGGGNSNSFCTAASCLTNCLGAYGISFQGTGGGNGTGAVASGGGGGAGGSGNSGGDACYEGNGGRGICTCIAGKKECFAGGGGGGAISTTKGGAGVDGGGSGGYCAASHYLGCPGTTCGSGGGGTGRGGACASGAGANGVVIVRYPTNGDYGITASKGGNCCYTCKGYCIHCFTTGGAFITSDGSGKCFINYLVVGGGGGGNTGGGGGGAVCCGAVQINKTSMCVIVGAGGAKCTGNGGASCIRTYYDTCYICAGGGSRGYGCTSGCTDCDGCTGYNYGGNSGNGNKGGVLRTCSSCASSCNTGGGGGGARGVGEFGYLSGGYAIAGNGGIGFMGYGGGGGGAYCNVTISTLGIDGGGMGVRCLAGCTTPTNCGGGGGGASSLACAGDGACGVVEICYPSDGSYGFSCATGGTKSLVNGYCVHRFTASGTFTIVS